MTLGSVMNATIRISLPHREHAKGSTAHRRFPLWRDEQDFSVTPAPEVGTAGCGFLDALHDLGNMDAVVTQA